MKFKPVNPKIDFFAQEEKTLLFWKKNRIFEKSVEQRSSNNPASFYDGPPFVTGVPHYGHLLGSIAKDIIPRYFAMKGKRVRRVWGWDCHGLPVENKVEKQLGLKNRRDIEKIGLEKFIGECRRYVSQTSAEWTWYIEHIGRWVDMENAYRTMDLSYMETVIWVFKKLYDKGLIYKGLRISLFCPRCSTPVSNFEIAMDNSYADRQDTAITVKFRIIDEVFLKKYNIDKPCHLLAWTTTPWSVISVMGLAVGENFTYQLIERDEVFFLLAKKRAETVMAGAKYRVITEFSGKEILGISYKHLFDYYDDDPRVKENDKVFRTYPADYVSEEEGTGIVTINGAFGEVDMASSKTYNLPVIVNVDDEGKFTPEVKVTAGVYVKDAEIAIIDYLRQNGFLFCEEKIVHSYPFCYRCETPLIYKAQDSWFIKVSELKSLLLETNKSVNWVPDHFKKGRFAEGIKNAPDWCISRTRYWATAMPVWECEKCQNREVFGSLAEIKKRTGKEVTDLHRPRIDTIIFPCQKCDGKMKRVREVLDCWMESGSMPYGERHYPFENKEDFEKGFPADYISEYSGQVRAWFYVLHVLSGALFGSPCFKNVVVSGVIMGTDGRKMSKSFNNFPDPKKIIETYGGDALRLYLMGSPTMAGQDMNVSEEAIKEQAKNILLILWNCYNFFVTHASLKTVNSEQLTVNSQNLLDKWILSRVHNFLNNFTESLDAYHIPETVRLVPVFLDDLSRWYIRRSRDRFETGDKEALATLYRVLIIFCKTTAPLIPFITEEIYQNLDRQKESVHLEDWPVADKKTIDKEIENKMDLVRKICEAGHAKRKELGLKVRQPLATARIHNIEKVLDEEYQDLIAAELNVKEVDFAAGKGETEVEFDTKLTSSLIAEGKAREIVRSVQEERKKENCAIDEKIILTLPDWPKEFESYIMKKTLAEKIEKGKELKISKVLNS